MSCSIRFTLGVTALVAMVVIFKKAMTKANGSPSVSPDEDSRRQRRMRDERDRERRRRESNLAWS